MSQRVGENGKANISLIGVKMWDFEQNNELHLSKDKENLRMRLINEKGIVF